MAEPGDLIDVDELSDGDIDLLSPEPLQTVVAHSSAKKATTPAKQKPVRGLLDAFEQAGDEEDFLM